MDLLLLNGLGKRTPLINIYKILATKAAIITYANISCQAHIGSRMVFAMSVICALERGEAAVLLSITATMLFLFIQYILKNPVMKRIGMVKAITQCNMR